MYVIYFSVNVGKYRILKSVGKGGMGEIFLAHDPTCGRDVALKQMREEWRDNSVMQERFLREAKIAAQLSHPSIIPIFSIEESFYTMPYIEGETLKEILRTTKHQMQRGEALHPIGSSVPALIRIFLSVSSAIAYAHSRGVLHRDIKPENIIVGRFGEVIILDWGLANFIGEPEKNGLEVMESSPDLTQPGKIPGTLLYMAPERAFAEKSSIVTDIYSLGVVLYQILTLQLPFHRKSVKEFRKMHEHETILKPEEIAPDREISPHLSSIVQRCLQRNPKKRFQSLSELIREIENYIEGIPEWQKATRLSIAQKDDWQFQENIALTKHRALTRGIESIEWVNLMVSKCQFPGNVSLEANLTLQESNQGMGFLFNIPETELANAIDQGFCMWFSSSGMKLYRSGVEACHADNIQLETGTPTIVRITNIDNHIRLYIDGVLQFSFYSSLPLSGSRVGLFFKDGAFPLSDLGVSIGSQNIVVNCLAIPDAFLSRGDYDQALEEYRKLSQSFPGRAEGREATFRAGLTLIDKAKTAKRKKESEELYNEALNEFEKLHNTAGGPLEYLGKSMVYKSQNATEEEAKSLELALRKYPTHPLKPLLVERILTRLHESSQINRRVAYRFALILFRFLPEHNEAEAFAHLIERHLEPLPFFIMSENRMMHLTIQLAFWLGIPSFLHDLIERGNLAKTDLMNAKTALYALGQNLFASLPQHLGEDHAYFWLCLFRNEPLPKEPYPLWHALLNKKWDDARQLVGSTNSENLNDEKAISFFLYGCYLAQCEGEGKATEHLTAISATSFPKLCTLFSHFLKGLIQLKNGWNNKALHIEKIFLLRQIELYAICSKNRYFSKLYNRLLKKD